jgi:hypothetical protein
MFASAVINRRYRTFRLLDQAHVVNLHLFIYRFAHVVNREQRDRRANERFHFDSGLRNCLRGAFNLCALVGSDDLDTNFREWQSVAKGNEMRRLFGSLDTRNPCSREDIAFRDLIVSNQIECLLLEPNLAGRNSSSFTHRFRRYVDHLRPAIGTDVSQPFPLSCSTCHSERSRGISNLSGSKGRLDFARHDR